jgi:hypothetical protein
MPKKSQINEYSDISGNNNKETICWKKEKQPLKERAKNMKKTDINDVIEVGKFDEE